MPRKSKKRSSSQDDTQDDRQSSSTRPRRARNHEPPPEDEEPAAPQRSVASHVRERQRAVAEREAARLARPEARPRSTLAHADRKKSAVTSTPFGLVPPKKSDSAPTSEEWCGPFSVARQMIAEREQAKRKQLEEEDEGATQEHHPLDQMMEELEQEKRQKQHPSILWKSNATLFQVEVDSSKKNGKVKKVPSLYATRKRRAAFEFQKGIPSLYDFCIQFMVDNFEHVESVGFVDASIRKRLAHELVGRNALNDAALQALAVPGMEALELVDASGITSPQLVESLQTLLPAGLRYLALDQAGRCFTPKVVELLVEHAEESKDRPGATNTLQALAFGGAYLLKDQNAASLMSAMEQTLQSVEFKACPLVGEHFCQSLVTTKELTLRELSLEDLTLSEKAWESLMAAAKGSKFWSHHLESLRLRRLSGLTDEKMDTILAKTKALTALDVSLNAYLSDATLGHIRASPACSVLSELKLGGLKLLTATGLEALFTVVPNMGPPPRLRLLDVGQCDYQAVTDDVLELVAQASSSTPPTNQGNRTLAPSQGLVHLNVQGSSLLTNTCLEVLVTLCSQTLQELNVSFCTQLTDQGLGYLVDHCGPQLKKVQVWGLAQVSEVFLDGHHRVKDSSLQVVGAWMKKNSVVAIR